VGRFVIVLETSALIALILREHDAPRIVETLQCVDKVVMSAVSRYEALVVLRGKKTPFEPELAVDAVLVPGRVEVIAFDEVQSTLAFQAYAKFGKGSGSAAKLNLADCAAFALATHLDAPLLFTGQDFTHTDVKRA
jgi:ribonuclease VapC